MRSHAHPSHDLLRAGAQKKALRWIRAGVSPSIAAMEAICSDARGEGSAAAQPGEAGAASGARRRAPVMLVLACALWGASFTWVKHTQAGMAEAHGLEPGATLWVPVLYIGWRFLAASVLWAVAFPRSLRGWSLKGLRRSALMGLLLALGMILQLLSLDRISQATCAFLTSLTIVFTPLAQWVLLRKAPPRRMLLCVALGAAGVYLMTAAGGDEMKPNELLGVGLGVCCAAAFSLHIVAVAHYGKEEDPWRLSLGQFLVLGVLGFLLSPVFGADVSPSRQYAMLAFPGVAVNLGLATVFATLGAFGLMFRYQPRISPTRGAIIYLTEPVFAAAYAWAFAASGMTALAIAGALAILSANLVARARLGGASKELSGAPTRWP